MSRQFPDFISAYFSYAKNQYAPEQFTLWTGLSVMAAAVERKVWLPEGNFENYPNLFVLLTSGPGIGKTSAIRQGLPLLYAIQKELNPNFKILEGVSSAAGLREIMTMTDNMPGGDINQFSSIYCVGREGSDSPLKNHGDDFRSMACSMYDCEDRYQFTLKTGVLDIPQPVMNMLVGVTFNFLGSVIDQESVFGGLASRFTYVIEKNSILKGDFFGGVTLADGSHNGDINDEADPEMRKRLIEDLKIIHKMHGSMRVKKDVFPLVNVWYNSFKENYNEMESERMQALLIRKRTLLKKVLILLSLSEGNDLLIKPHHVEKAIELVEGVTKDNPYILSRAITMDKHDQMGITQTIAQALKTKGGAMTRKQLRLALLSKGNDVERLEKTFDYMLGSGWLSYDSSTGMVKLLIDSDRYL